MTNEVGREMPLEDLRPETVVLISKRGGRTMATAWVQLVGMEFVCFGMGEIRTTFLALRKGGKLYDDSGSEIVVNEYLGEV